MLNILFNSTHKEAAMKNLFLLFILLIFATNPVLSQDTIHVPADYSTIQAAINVASSGDVINYFGE